MVGKNFHALYVSESADKVSGAFKVFVLVANSGNKHVADPDWLFNFVQVAEHFYYVCIGTAGKLFVLGWVNVLYVHKEYVRNLHKFLELLEPFTLFCKGTAGRVYAGIDAFFFCKGKKVKQKIQLHQRLSTGNGNSALCSPVGPVL